MNEASTIPSDQIAVAWRQRRVNMLPGVTARGLAALLDGFDRGYLRQASLAWEEMCERDETLVTAVPKMKRRVASRPWDVLVGEEVPDALQAEAEKHQAALKRFYSTITVTNAVEQNERGGLKLLVRRMMNAPLQRYAAARIIWRPSPGGIRAEIRHCPLALFDATQGGLRWSGVEGITPGKPLDDPENWLIAVSDTCLMKALSVCYIFKRLPMQDALNFCQHFGIPTVHGETKAAFGSDDWKTFVQALQEFANTQSIATALGDKINVLANSAANGEQVFGWIIDAMKRAMVTICCGSDLATMSRENGAGASLQGDDADELTADFCDFITELFNEQLDRRVIEMEFGEGVEPLAFFKLIPPQKQDASLEMKIDDHVSKYGVMLSVEDVAERYNRTHDEAAARQGEADQSGDAAANAANEAIASLAQKQRDAFTLATRRDLKPLQEALNPLVNARGADETRNAAQTLMLGMSGLEDAILDGDASTAALEVSLATEFLRGLAANARG